jgi:hypothetical protein
VSDTRDIDALIKAADEEEAKTRFPEPVDTRTESEKAEAAEFGRKLGRKLVETHLTNIKLP